MVVEFERVLVPEREPRPAEGPGQKRQQADDGGSEEALLLAHDWRMPGDERTIADRLGSGTVPPGSKPEWTAERTGERTYRVTFTPSGTETGYDFDVDLSSRRVDPTPETAELISPRLTAQR